MVQTRSKKRPAHDVNGNGVNGSLSHDMKESASKAVGHDAQSSILASTISPLLLMAWTPNLIMWIWYTVKFHNGSYAAFFSALWNSSDRFQFLLNVWSPEHVTIGSQFSILVIGGYMLFQLILMVIVPGPRIEGPITPNGNVPVYKDNGFRIYLITMATFGLLTYYLKTYTVYSPSMVHDHFGDLLATMNAFSLIFCVGLYLKGLFAPTTSDSGSTGNPIMDYYWGTELYPRIFGIDVKVFTNCRFGCTVWGLLPCCFTIKAYEQYGFDHSINNFVSLAILLIYLTKFFWWEGGYMCTMDIILDRAGFYICWGCLVFIPGLYASFGYYLASHPIALGYPCALSILAAGIGCVAINYVADWQRQDVRAKDGKTTIWGRKPEIIRAKYRTTQGEDKSSILLVSGFWGLARHFHYLPEIGLAFFWSVPAGFHNILPYSYVLFLTPLLIHRTFRDDIKCTEKYGPYWEMYRKKVPHRIVPYVF